MKTSSILAFSSFLLASMVEAAPVDKRARVIVTKTEEVVETVDITTTIYVNEMPSTVAAPATSSSAGGYFYERPSKPASAPAQVQPTSAPASSSVAVPSSVVPSSVVAPSSAYVAPVVASSAYVAPVVSSAPAYTPPVSSTTPAPVYTEAASSTVAAPAPSSSASSGTPSGQTYSGDITYYNPGGNTGACGDALQDTDMVVALAAGMMGAQSNGNPWCGKSITIKLGGATAVAKIADKCPGCEGASIDLTPAVWDAFASQCDGRCHDVSWYVNE